MNNEIQAKIELKLEWAQHYENLIHSLKSAHGQSIIAEIQNKINEVLRHLTTLSLQDLPAPYYEYHKDDLQRMKAYRAQKQILEELKQDFNIEKLTEKVTFLRKEADALKNGASPEPVYTN